MDRAGGKVIGSRGDAPVPPEGAWERVLVHELVSRPRRATTPSLPDLQALAEQHGVGDIFSSFMEAAKARGFGIARRPSGVGLRCPRKEGKKGIVLSLFLDRSDADRGIHLAIDAEGLGDRRRRTAGCGGTEGRLHEHQPLPPRAGGIHSPVGAYIHTLITETT